MKHYKVKSKIKNVRGIVIAEHEATFEADDPREAFVSAHGDLRELVEQHRNADVVSSTATCIEDGDTTHTTDYADEIGNGLSSSGLTEEIDRPDEEQAEQEKRDIGRQAVDAVLTPEQKRELVETESEDADPIEDFFGGERPSERLKRAGGVPVGTDNFPVGRSQEQPIRGHSQGDAGLDKGGLHSGQGCDKSFSDCKRHNNAHRFPVGLKGKCPFVFGDKHCGVRGADPGNQAPSNAAGAGQGAGAAADLAQKQEGQRLLDAIRGSATRAFQNTARYATGVNVNPTDAKLIGKALGLPPGASINGGTYQGLNITVDPALGRIGPQLIMSDSSGTYKPSFAQGGMVKSRSVKAMGVDLGGGQDAYVKKLWSDGELIFMDEEATFSPEALDAMKRLIDEHYPKRQIRDGTNEE